MLALHYQKDPATLDEQQVREFFMHLCSTRQGRPSAIISARSALKRFYCGHLKTGQQWALWDQIRVRTCHKIPQLLTREELKRFFGAITHARYRTLLRLIYHTGLRLGEALHLQVEDIDGQALRLYVRHRPEHAVKTRRERYVPFSPAMLGSLRRFWKRHQHPKWLFPAVSPHWKAQGSNECQAVAQCQGPMCKRVVQKAMSQALAACGITKKATPHTLRHCFATHLLEEGVHLRLIAKWMGHVQLASTLVYLQCTEINEAQGRQAQQRLLSGARRPA